MKTKIKLKYLNGGEWGIEINGRPWKKFTNKVDAEKVAKRKTRKMAPASLKIYSRDGRLLNTVDSDSDSSSYLERKSHEFF